MQVNVLPVLLIAVVLIASGVSTADAPTFISPAGTSVQEFRSMECPDEPEPEVLICEATAYTWTGNRTATGTWPSRGTIAVDPTIIPLGTRLFVEGYGEGIAEDVGGAIQGEIIDLYMESEDECWAWGRRTVEVKIIKE